METPLVAVLSARIASTADLFHDCEGEVASALITSAGQEVCVVEIERDGRPLTLLIDSQWARLGLEVREANDTGMDYDIPKNAILMVVDGSPGEWPDPRVEHRLILGDDEVLYAEKVAAGGCQA